MIDDTTKTETPDEVTDAGESNEDVTAETAPASLTINDLSNIKQIIDVASARGAFKPNEFNVVGTTYDRLSAFLASVMPAPVAEDADSETADETAEA